MRAKYDTCLKPCRLAGRVTNSTCWDRSPVTSQSKLSPLVVCLSSRIQSPGENWDTAVFFTKVFSSSLARKTSAYFLKIKIRRPNGHRRHSSYRVYWRHQSVNNEIKTWREDWKNNGFTRTYIVPRPSKCHLAYNSCRRWKKKKKNFLIFRLKKTRGNSERFVPPPPPPTCYPPKKSWHEITSADTTITQNRTSESAPPTLSSTLPQRRWKSIMGF